jgi:hypothetical protein
VTHQSAIAFKYNDIAGPGFDIIMLPHRQNVTRPDGGQHAAANDTQAQFPEGAEHLRRQLTSDCFS